jgi:hypothetical protein
MYLSDRSSLVLQQDGFTDQMKEARLRSPSGAIVAAAAVHNALPGEPRVCGTSDVAPPLVVTLAVGADVAAALKASDGRYVLEVKEDGFDWHSTDLVDWSKIAGQPCFR